MCDLNDDAMTTEECTKWSFVWMANFTEKVPIDEESGVPIISDEVMTGIHIYGNLLLRGSIAVFGAVNNIINMIIFYRLGLKDSMSVGLWVLSFSDFVVTFLGLFGTACFVWETFFPYTAIEPVSFEFVTVGWVRDIAQLISGWITTFLSIERCVCVVFPFKVKQIFTRTRSLVLMVVIYVVHIAVHIPVFASQWLGWTTINVNIGNETVQRQRMVVMFSDARPQIQFYIDIANGAVLPFPSQILLLISVVWMIYGLRASSRIRTLKPTNDKDEEGSKKESKLSFKERRLVKVVLFLAIILFVCNIPRFLAVYAKQIFAEVSIGRQYANLYVLLWNLAAFAGIVNSSVNIFVYMIINSSYRATFKTLFGRANTKGRN